VRKRMVVVGALLVALVVLAGCMPDANPSQGTGENPAGFLAGLWHGFIIGISFIVSLFNDGVSIYEVNNNGGWYDFGYVLGAMSALGGGGGGAAAGAKRRR